MAPDRAAPILEQLIETDLASVEQQMTELGLTEISRDLPPSPPSAAIDDDELPF
jgi:hypothetical protein